MQGMVLGTVVDSNVLSYPVLVIMKEQDAVVGRGGASPQSSGKAEPTLRRRVGQNQPSDVERGGVGPLSLGKAEPGFSRRARRSPPSEVGQGGTSP